jgi:hypothetical protein
MTQMPKAVIEQIKVKGKTYFEVYVTDKKVFVTDDKIEAKLFVDRLKSVCQKCKKE